MLRDSRGRGDRAAEWGGDPGP